MTDGVYTLSKGSGSNIVASNGSGSNIALKKTVNDFNFGKTLGEGSYGVVKIGVEKATGIEFAVKILDKAQMVKEKKTSWVNREKVILDSLRHPFVVNLFYTFQDATYLYFVLEFCENGELLKKMKSLGAFSESVTRYYIAEIITALEHIHSMGVIHRDLKPENILLDSKNHIKLIDFGTAKQIGDQRIARSDSFCGTAEYVSPETLNDQTAGRGSDLWALGCIVYQFITGRLPFRAVNDYHVFQLIRKREYVIPEGFSPLAHDLVDKLIVLDPDSRLGNRTSGYPELKEHPFFQGINWETLPEQIPPPFAPPEKSVVFPPEPTLLVKSPSHEELLASLTPEESQSDSERQKLLEQSKSSIWGQFLIPNKEVIVETGLVWKKAGLFSRKRQLILTDLPRFFYVDPDKMVQKGEIPWSDKVRAVFKSPRVFWVVTPNRTYYFEDFLNDSQRWVDAVTKMINKRPLQ